MKWTSLGSDIWQQPPALAPLNFNPELFHPKAGLSTWTWLWPEPCWPSLKDIGPPSPSFPPWGSEEPLSSRGKDCCGFVGLFMSCWILLRGKGEGENLLPSYFFVTNSKSWFTFVLHLPRVLLLFSFTYLWGPWLAAGQATRLLLVVVSNSLDWAGQTLVLVTSLVLIAVTIVPFCQTAREALQPIHC